MDAAPRRSAPPWRRLIRLQPARDGPHAEHELSCLAGLSEKGPRHLFNNHHRHLTVGKIRGILLPSAPVRYRLTILHIMCLSCL